MKRRIPYLTLFSIFFICCIMWCFQGCDFRNSRIEKLERVTPLTKHWEQSIPLQKIPKGLFSLNASNCGACHQDHYKEWKRSTHGHAWTDEQYQAEIGKKNSPFFCINCHIPLQNQQEYITDGLINGNIFTPHQRKNKRFDRSLQLEGITCAVCHVRDGFIIGTKGEKNRIHPVKKDVKFLSEGLCISCHNANAKVKADLVCSFETGDEWKKGPYANQKNCIDCHMPKKEGSLIMGGVKKQIHLHSFPGSGISKNNNYQADGLKSLFVEFALKKNRMNQAEPISAKLTLKNEFAGHRVPTGDPERYYQIECLIRNEKGEIVYRKKDRIGEKWTWSPIAKKIADNNLNCGETRVFDYSTKLIEKGNYSIECTIEKFRMNKESYNFHKLSINYPISKVVYHKKSTFIVY